MDKTTRIALVFSVFWLTLIGVVSNDRYSFDGEMFMLIGILPLLVYWSWRFIKGAKT